MKSIIFGYFSTIKNNDNFFFFCFVLAFMLTINQVYSEDTIKSKESDNILKWEHLSGSWGGVRTKLIENGLDFHFVYQGELWRPTTGDINKVTTDNYNFDILLNTDLDKLIGWNGSRIFFHGIGNYGKNPADNIGIRQGISNIAAYPTWKIFELFLEQNFLDERISILFGLVDLNSQVDSKIVSKLFLNPSHGIGIDFGQSGKNGPSIYPTTSLTLRTRFVPFDNFYMQFGVLDGIAGDPQNPKGTHVILKKEDGLLVNAETGYSKGCQSHELPGNEKCKNEFLTKLGFGLWYYTDSFNHLFSGVTNWGVYTFFEQEVYFEPGDYTQGLALHGRIGVADDLVNQFNYFIGAAMVYTGLIPTRNFDETGIAIASGHNSYLYRLAKYEAIEKIDAFEHDIEFTYKFVLSPAIIIQPDIQYIISPSLLDKKETVLVFGTRLMLIF